MSFLLDNLFSLIYWLVILGGIGWWFWFMRRSSAPPKRTKAEDAELARLRARLAPSGDEPGPDEPVR